MTDNGGEVWRNCTFIGGTFSLAASGGEGGGRVVATNSIRSDQLAAPIGEEMQRILLVGRTAGAIEMVLAAIQQSHFHFGHTSADGH